MGTLGTVVYLNQHIFGIVDIRREGGGWGGGEQLAVEINWRAP